MQQAVQMCNLIAGACIVTANPSNPEVKFLLCWRHLEHFGLDLLKSVPLDFPFSGITY